MIEVYLGSPSKAQINGHCKFLFLLTTCDRVLHMRRCFLFEGLWQLGGVYVIGRAGLNRRSCHGKLASPAVVRQTSFSGDRHAREALSLVAELFASSHGTCSI